MTPRVSGLSRSRRWLFGTVLVAATLSACTPMRDVRGYVPDATKVADIKIGEDTKQSVQAKLGTPSSTASFGDPTWYYISIEQERYAFFSPDVTKREILAVQFNETGKVAEVRNYGIEDGQVIALVDRETPSRGKELSFLQQVFGNIGGPSASGGAPSGPGRPGGGQ
jgi:outer membrane protein assembly factor BamE (lipoprotein component of BamABCDE complex)